MSLYGRAPAFKWDFSTGLASVLAAVLCFVPLVGFLAAWHMRVELPQFTRAGVLPALVLLAVCEWYLVRRSPLLFNRFASGLVGGLVATLLFDLVRVPGALAMKGAPDLAPVIGQHLTGEAIGIAPSMKAIALGYGYEYLLVGALLGAAYSLILGRGRWYWGTICGLVAGIGFVSLPQFGLFSVAEGFSLPMASAFYLVAFLVAGTALGAVVQRLGRTTTNAFYVVFLREERVEAPELVGAGR